MSNGMKWFLAIAALYILIKHPGILNQIINALNQALNG